MVLIMETLGIYIHIPFCVKKCAYCDFYSLCDLSLRENYVNALISQITSFRAEAKNKIVDTIYIGGGTPSILSGDQILKILKTVRKVFKVSGDSVFESIRDAVQRFDHFYLIDDIFYLIFLQRADEVDACTSIQRFVMGEQLLYAVFADERDTAFADSKVDLLHGACFHNSHDFSVFVCIHDRARVVDILFDIFECFHVNIPPNRRSCRRKVHSHRQ